MTDAMSTMQLRRMWKAGVDLRDAWLHFAADPIRNDLKDKPGFADAFAHLKSVVQSTRDGKLVLVALQTAGKAHLEELATRKPLQEALLETLASERLMAVGYSDAAAPVVIDAEAIGEANPDWENSRLRVNGTLYEKVRVADPAAVDTLLNDAQAARNAARAEILATLEELLVEDADFGSRVRKEAAQRIRDRMGKDYERGNGLSDPNLARYIRRTCGPKVTRQPEA